MQPGVPTTIVLILSVCITAPVCGAAADRLETGSTADREGAAKRIAAVVPSNPYAKPQRPR